MGIKVTREMLDRYRKLKQEIPVLELELLMMKNTEAGLGNDTIFDYQTGYPRPQSVVGFDQKKYDRREKVLERKKEKVKAMDQWIDDIKDGQTRCVFRMFYKQNMTWKAIAKQIGMPHNEDYPRLMIRDKYLKISLTNRLRRPWWRGSEWDCRFLRSAPSVPGGDSCHPACSGHA